MKTTKQQLTQIILEEIAALFKEGAWAKYSKSAPELPQIKDPEVQARAAKIRRDDRMSKAHKAKKTPSELDRILGSDKKAPDELGRILQGDDWASRTASDIIMLQLAGPDVSGADINKELHLDLNPKQIAWIDKLLKRSAKPHQARAAHDQIEKFLKGLK